MLMLEANFQIQKFQIDVTPISATTKKKQKIGPILHSPPGTQILQVSLSSPTFFKNHLYSPYFPLGPFYLPWFLPPSPKSHCSAKGHNDLTSKSSGNSPVPVSLKLSVASDARVHFLILTLLLRSASVTPASPLRRCLLTTPPPAPSSLQSWCWLRIPSLAHCSSHFTFSLRHLSSNHQLVVTPKSVMTSTSPPGSRPWWYLPALPRRNCPPHCPYWNKGGPHSPCARRTFRNNHHTLQWTQHGRAPTRGPPIGTTANNEICPTENDGN